LNAPDRFAAVKQRFGAAELLDLAKSEGLRHRGSGRNRCECPGCRGDPRGVSIGEKNGVGLWHCFRDESHRGTAIDFIACARGISVRDALTVLEDRSGSEAEKPARPPLQEKSYPPAAEVADVWARARPLSEIRDACAAWRARGIDVGTVEDRDLARALRCGVRLPRWAWGAGSSWSAGAHRLIVPMYDAAGEMVTLHARAAMKPEGKSKGLSPCGHQVRGSIMADSLGREMLRAQATPRDVLVGEGVPDFLTWATHWGEAAENAPAVLAVISGSWSDEIAARIPDGARVGVATHEDDKGEEYAATIARTIARRCTALRVRFPEGRAA
jgi:hypothetical protein